MIWALRMKSLRHTMFHFASLERLTRNCPMMSVLRKKINFLDDKHHFKAKFPYMKIKSHHGLAGSLPGFEPQARH